jgi:hypothetical protein
MADAAARASCASMSWGQESDANSSVHALPRKQVHDVVNCKVQTMDPFLESIGRPSDHTMCTGSAYAFPPMYQNLNISISAHGNPYEGARAVETQHRSLMQLLNRGRLPRSSRRIAVTERSESTRRIPLRIERPQQQYGIPRPNKQQLEASISSKNGSRSRASPFPEKLYSILQDSRFSDILSWTDNGKSWRVLQTRSLQEEVLPRYFRSDRYTSFMRQVRLNFEPKSIMHYFAGRL